MTETTLLVFDCDGVLIDSEIITSHAHARALGELGFAITAEDIVRRFTGMPDTAMYPALEAEWGKPLPADYDTRFKADVIARYASELRAIDGVHAALDALPWRRCVASSSTPGKLRAGLGAVGLYDYFAPHIFSATQVARGKPWPDLFQFAAEQMNAVPAECLVIEDSVAGVEAALAAGMPVIGFAGGSHCGPGWADKLLAAGADGVFDDMRALPAIVQRRLR
jgi:HAD superfamily hydrolase (TIGR01509 family)